VFYSFRWRVLYSPNQRSNHSCSSSWQGEKDEWDPVGVICTQPSVQTAAKGRPAELSSLQHKVHDSLSYRVVQTFCFNKRPDHFLDFY